jgi:hypothetical protein
VLDPDGNRLTVGACALRLDRGAHARSTGAVAQAPPMLCRPRSPQMRGPATHLEERHGLRCCSNRGNEGEPQWVDPGDVPPWAASSGGRGPSVPNRPRHVEVLSVDIIDEARIGNADARGGLSVADRSGLAGFIGGWLARAFGDANREVHC